MSYALESDYHIDISKKKFNHENFKIDTKEMLNHDKKLKEGKFSDLTSYTEHYKKNVRR